MKRYIGLTLNDSRQSRADNLRLPPPPCLTFAGKHERVGVAFGVRRQIGRSGPGHSGV